MLLICISALKLSSPSVHAFNLKPPASDSITIGFANETVVADNHKPFGRLVAKHNPYGHVVIVLSRGRSGSDFLCRVVENAAGAKVGSLSGGILGSSDEKMAQMKDPRRTIKVYIREKRQRQTHNIIGFKWKYYVDAPRFDEAFRWAAKQNFKFLFSHRNPLDEFISRAKHRYTNKQSNALRSHCKLSQQDYNDCLQQARGTHVQLSIDMLLPFITNRTAEIINMRQKLNDMHIQYLEIRYEDVAFGTDEDRLKQLQRIVDFAVPRKHQHELTMKDFDTNSFITSAYNQSLSISNFEEVKHHLQATAFADLLHG